MDAQTSHQPLLQHPPLQKESDGPYTGDGSVDFQGRPVLKNKTGTWRACLFILGNECCERLAYYGIAQNLVNYLTGKLHEGNVSAARNVTTWAGTCYLTTLIGAFLADSYWGRYWTIAVFSIIYFIGLCTLTISAAIPALKPAECLGSACPSATPAQYGIFFFGLYLIALGTGGIKPCVSSFGADQFDDTDSKESIQKGSFFNWFYFCINIGSFISSVVIVWVQENVGWGIGFGIPAICMGAAIACFFAGTHLYRFQRPGKSPLTRVCQVVVASWRKRELEVPQDRRLLYETSDEDSAGEGSQKLEHTNGLKCLDKAAVLSSDDRKTGLLPSPWRLCTITQVEGLKTLLRMFPIWATGIVFSAVFSQMSTMFVEQGMVMDRTVGLVTIPAASLSTANTVSVMLWVPLYDRVLVPVAQKLTGKGRGFSELQRMGIGLFLSILAMVAAALLEMQRLQLVNRNVGAQLNILWQVPQFFLVGAAEVFLCPGQVEFFYDEAPDQMRSLSSASCLLTVALGDYLNALILTIVRAITTSGGRPGWIPDDLNEGRLDKFFWLLAGLSFVNLVVYVFCAMRYKGKRSS